MEYHQELFPNGIQHDRKKFLIEGEGVLSPSISLIRNIAETDGRWVTPPGVEPELPP